MANVIEVIFRSVDEISKGVKGIDGSLNLLQRTAVSATKWIGGLFVAEKVYQFAKAAVQASDAMQEMNEVLAQMRPNMDAVLRTQQDIARVAMNTDTTYQTTFELYARLAQSNDRLRLSEQQRLQVVESINMAQQLAGPLAGDVAQSFSRMLVTGEVSGRALISIFTRAPRLLKALEDETGKTSEQLKKMGEDGTLTIDMMMKALTNQSQNIREDFKKTGQTVEESLTNIGTAFVQLITRVDNALGVTDFLAMELNGLAQIIADLADADTPSDLINDDLIERSAELNAALEKRAMLQDIIAKNDPNIKVGLIPRDPNEVLVETEENIKTLNAQVRSLQEAFRGQKALEEVEDGIAGLGEATGQTSKQVDDMIEALELQAFAIGKSAREVELHKLQLAGATPEVLAHADALLRQGEAAAANAVAFDAMIEEVLASVQEMDDVDAVINETLSGIANQRAERTAEAAAEQVQTAFDAMIEEVLASVREMDEVEAIVNETLAGIAEKEIEDKAQRVQVVWDQAMRNMQDITAEWLLSFGKGTKDMLKSFTDMLRSMVAQALAANLIKTLFGSLDTSSGFGQILGSVFGLPKAIGGDTTPGLLHQVNERGPEFLMTANRGRVIPLDKMAANGASAGGGSVFAPVTNIYPQTQPMDAAALARYMKRRDQELLNDFRMAQIDGAVT